MKTIWKFPLDIQDNQQLWMPQGATILSVMVQGEQLCLWAEVETTAACETRHFVVRGTGNPISESVGAWRPRHLASVIMGQFVWHVYELVHPLQSIR